MRVRNVGSDDNKRLKHAQHERYSCHVGEIFYAARAKFVEADAILNAKLKAKEISQCFWIGISYAE